MALPTRSRTSLGSAASVSPFQAVPVVFLLGWVLLVAGETLAPMGAPAVPLVAAVVAGILFGSEIGMAGGLSVGLAADLLTALPVGSQAGAGAIAGYLAGGLSTALSTSNWLAPAALVAVAGLPFRMLVGLLSQLGGRPATALGFGQALPLAPWDVGAAVVMFAALSAWQARRR